ncbi:UDP-glucuronate decarboxylase [Clostridium cavendishii DSM 21758]|uniref:UDP-glucuronate decarboxylase n=1 Tax=Clostridium cavendishii DSM 21758 TaxID=1121302 RepID=A0A1M6IY81_9CLOT|nr:NAD-dependent epimerase/dehydratase family protein [Clostridium cavendishii]SHJ39394.1 UDP-glucuronate decarboxylase [Clostridium cavendishii DSM 21758]
MNLNRIVLKDMDYIIENLSLKEKNCFKGSNILITGCAGFLGYYFINFFTSKMDCLGINSIIGLDNFKLGKADWIHNIAKENSNLKIYNFDITKDNIENIEGTENCNLIIHMASIASPIFYRQYPIETLDANIWGLRNLLDFYKNKNIKGFLFFSSSEIYGNPTYEFIPTSEEYNGNVSPLGPRACYDESKRFGETMCYLFSNQYNMPITIARPFNNYGPGMKLDDQRVPADFAKAVFENRDIVMFSDGSPTRTFCYIADAIIGYLKVLTYGKFDYFNIGIDTPEISIKELADIYVDKAKKIFGHECNAQFQISSDKDYLTNNPARRCPDISKAKTTLMYNPSIDVETGVERFLEYIKINNGEL